MTELLNPFITAALGSLILLIGGWVAIHTVTLWEPFCEWVARDSVAARFLVFGGLSLLSFGLCWVVGSIMLTA